MFALFIIGIASISLNADSFVNRVLTEAKIIQRIDKESDRLLKSGLGGNFGDVKIEKLANKDDQQNDDAQPKDADVKEDKEQPEVEETK